jgi:hypothetical protein
MTNAITNTGLVILQKRGVLMKYYANASFYNTKYLFLIKSLALFCPRCPSSSHGIRI